MTSQKINILWKIRLLITESNWLFLMNIFIFMKIDGIAISKQIKLHHVTSHVKKCKVIERSDLEIQVWKGLVIRPLEVLQMKC